MNDSSVVKVNIQRAQTKLLMLNEELEKLAENDCENVFGEMAIKHVNDELIKLLNFLNP